VGEVCGHFAARAEIRAQAAIRIVSKGAKVTPAPWHLHRHALNFAMRSKSLSKSVAVGKRS
jgi:hypothetical protein